MSENSFTQIFSTNIHDNYTVAYLSKMHTFMPEASVYIVSDSRTTQTTAELKIKKFFILVGFFFFQFLRNLLNCDDRTPLYTLFTVPHAVHVVTGYNE